MMTQGDMPDDLASLGDALERAARHDLRARSRRRVRLVVAAVAALSIVATGTAVATSLFSPRQVAEGMPAGAAIFGSTSPTCVLDADQVTYHCRLASPPAPEVTDFTGTKELLAIDGTIAGGCIGQDSAGMTWSCYLGHEAVTRDILVEDLLGQPQTAPGRG